MPWRDISDSADVSQREIDEVIKAYKRRARPRFYADENFPPLAVEILRSVDAKVVTTDDSGLRGRSDEDHAAFALKEGYILLTCDRDYLNNARFPLNRCPAIFVFDFGNGGADEIRLAFRCLRFALSAPEFYDKWTKVDASRDAWIEYARFRNGSTSRCRLRVHARRVQEWIDDDAA